MNKLFKRVMSGCLALALVLCVTVPVEKADAASVGDQQYKFQVYTLAEINALCNKFEDVSDQVVSGDGVARILASVAEVPVVGTLYTVMTGLIQYDMSKEYKFYKGVRDEMIKRGSKRVTIKYISEYSVYKIYWEKFYAWKAVDKEVYAYK